eukprot:9489207-Alexandrium_andersonii.AAC.1
MSAVTLWASARSRIWSEYLCHELTFRDQILHISREERPAGKKGAASARSGVAELGAAEGLAEAADAGSLAVGSGSGETASVPVDAAGGRLPRAEGPRSVPAPRARSPGAPATSTP